MKHCSPNCDMILVLAALTSMEMARTLEPEQLELLAAFFQVLGDNLGLLAICSGAGESSAGAEVEESAIF